MISVYGELVGHNLSKFKSTTTFLSFMNAFYEKK